MTDPAGREAARNRRRRWIAVTAALVGLTMIVPLSAALIQQGFGSPESASGSEVAAVPTPAGPSIKPLTVRPVVKAVMTTPEECPQGMVGPPTETVQLCDIEKTALFTLSAEAVQLQLTQAEALLSPLNNSYYVQVALTPESAQTFSDFTAANIGKQVAFVRGGVVVSAPSIGQRLDGDTLQLSGEMTAEESEGMARLLRDEA
ncbi:SecDF P1 head subdomain-containing protein [Mycolicibacterium confluentis]|uniref:SecDF P1 head subdomain domain-containing protein n=1 Tax=Mycolicibacterium confluentis TaxID=28047 RepID=A0A7I7XX39_9MYCO|nr:hypothetical protein [Mycolicibacterium confluentis]MCV7318587.1 hypothetical protein [Mycolicibacterium confluentis]ORV23768.1 hypothetical protein AWB99_23300 [Mycolicibacterium confluentis]BBZ33869.1 hypothetical protein MCNF_24740 [Mycolicibacterium confluentis]